MSGNYSVVQAKQRSLMDVPSYQLVQHPVRRLGDLGHRGVKRSLIDLRRLAKTTDLPYVLQSGLADFVLAGVMIHISQGFDASAHLILLYQPNNNTSASMRAFTLRSRREMAFSASLTR